MKKSLTQMTKKDLMEVISEKNKIIAELNSRIDELEGMAIASQTLPMDADSSDLVTTLKAQIELLTSKLEKSKE